MFSPKKKALLVYPAIALFALSSNMLMAEEMVQGYVKSSSGEVYKNRFGECWRTNYKDTTEKLEECGYEAEETVVVAVTEAPVVVVAKSISEEVVYENIAIQADLLFAFDSSVLTSRAKSIINEGVERFAAKPATIDHISIIGHTDSTGTETYNQDLSERRAKAVGDYLVTEKGVPVEQITTSGKGESEPTASNATRTGRMENRRVEVQIIGKKVTTE